MASWADSFEMSQEEITVFSSTSTAGSRASFDGGEKKQARAVRAPSPLGPRGRRDRPRLEISLGSSAEDFDANNGGGKFSVLSQYIEARAQWFLRGVSQGQRRFLAGGGLSNHLLRHQHHPPTQT